VDPARDPRGGAGPALSPSARPPASPAPGRGRRLRLRLRAWLRPPRVLRPTRAGWCFFAITFGVGFAALNTGNNLLYLVLSLMLAFLALSGVLSEAALRGIEVRRRLPRELFAGAGNRVGLEIRNRQRRVPAFAVVVEDRVVAEEPERSGDEPRTASAGRAFALRVEAGETAVRSYRLWPARRGSVRFHGFVVSTRFPFGLFLKSLRLQAPAEALVFPAVERTAPGPVRGTVARAGQHDVPRAGDGTSVSGVRDFAEGDPLGRIHWKSSLRRGELLVRELDDERDLEVEVRLRNRAARSGSRFEDRVRRAASEVVAHLEEGRAVALRTDEGRLDAGLGARQRALLLGALARLEPLPPAGEPLLARPRRPEAPA